MQMRRNPNSSGDEREVFDDVLALKGGYPRPLPGRFFEVDEREEGRDHMEKEEREDYAFCAGDKKEDADEHFKQCEKEVEGIKRHPIDGLVKQ